MSPPNIFFEVWAECVRRARAGRKAKYVALCAKGPPGYMAMALENYDEIHTARILKDIENVAKCGDCVHCGVKEHLDQCVKCLETDLSLMECKEVLAGRKSRFA